MPEGPYDDKQVLTICISCLWSVLKGLTRDSKLKSIHILVEDV